MDRSRQFKAVCALAALACMPFTALAAPCATMGATELVHSVRYCADSALRPQSGNVYGPANLFDGDGRTAWCEGVPGDGAGQRLVLSITDGAPFDRILLFNGYQKSRTAFSRNARPRVLMVETDLGERIRFNLPDRTGELVLGLKRMAVREKVTFTIEDVYRGSHYTDTCISDLFLDFESGRDAVAADSPEQNASPGTSGEQAAGMAGQAPAVTQPPVADGGGDRPADADLREIAPLPDLPGL